MPFVYLQDICNALQSDFFCFVFGIYRYEDSCLNLQDPELSLHARSVEASQGSEGTTALQSA